MSPPPRWSGGKPRASWRRVKIVALAAVLLALVGSLVAWLLFHQPFAKPRFLPLVLDEYRHGIPLRRWARQDAESLQNLGMWSNKAESLTGQTRELLEDKLRRLGEAKDGETIVVFLSGYVVADEQGTLYLLPLDGVTPDGNLADKTAWLPLDNALSFLQNKKPLPRRKVL
jgi:hypothetical protein